MNLRNVKGDYNIGLDMGTGSVGWAVTDEKGSLLHFKKQPTWGSRLFDSAETAASARIPRGQRRRYVRRRWRLDLLQTLFQDEVAKVDPEFFIRLRQSRLLKEDRAEGYADYVWPLFNDSDFTEVDYYNRFPTIYHLRKWLIETDEKADIRLIYLAAHNIVKHRGNFLRQDQTNLTAKSARPTDALEAFHDALVGWCDELGYACGPNKSAVILGILEDDHMANSDKKKQIAGLIGVAMDDMAAESKKCNEALAAGMVGLKAEFKNVFGEISAEQTSIYLWNDEAVDALREGIPDEGLDLFNALCNVYSAYVLQGLLSYAPGEMISANMVKKYEQYGEDLALLKALVREYAPSEYDVFFRGEMYPGTNIYNAAKAEGYTKYNLGPSKSAYKTKMPYEEFEKAVKKLFAGTAAEEDARYRKMMAAFGKQQFLRRLKTSDNGSIYYQLHLEELRAILENQAKWYPFLKEDAAKIESLVSFRIPYYVGPLTSRNAAVDHAGKQRFAWSERKPGMESATIAPWNWDEVIDRGKSAEKFIMRMTGMCTYLQGEDVLPKCSLLYEEFCVLNELNGARWSVDGDDEHRFDAADREGIVEDLFKRYRTVSYKKVQDWLAQHGQSRAHVIGGQGASGFESKLGSYIFFCKDVFNVEKLDRADYPMIEEIILWNTLFEDRKILKEKLVEKYGDRLNAEQIKKICKKRFTGWGRLSRKFLTGVKVDTDCGPKSIMDVLREGDPNAGHRGRTMVMMEALRDEDLGFQKRIDEINKAFFNVEGKKLEVNELPGSPAIRRSLNQAIRIVDEIVKIAGKAPENLFVKVTRDDEVDKRGKRTKRRYDQLQTALDKFKSEHAEYVDPEFESEFKTCKQNSVDLDERLMLYFMQRGKCLYSGRPIKIDQLSNAGMYEVDHIIPRSYVKDDSLENKALVYREENQKKTDAMLIDPAIRAKMRGYWGMLHDAGLIGDKKFKNLLRPSVDDKAMKGFIARQLVETSQTVKLTQSLLAARYLETKIVPVKANMSHDLRLAANFVKCREANDFHHAHDAFLACRMGLFIQMRHPGVYDNPIGMTHVMRKYARQQSEYFKRHHRVPGTSGFIVNSFMTSGFNKETGEIFQDTWDAEKEVESIRKALNYRQCFISRMPVEDSGVFWDATIYSPRDGKKLGLPLKKGLNPNKYGSFSREQFAYFFVYEASDKKGKRVFRFAQVPVWLASKIRSDSKALERYAKELAEGEKLEFVRIERAKILKKQLVEIDGDLFFITGKREMRNGREIALSQQDMGILNGNLGDCSLDILSQHLADKAGDVGRRISDAISLTSLPEMTADLPEDNRLVLMRDVIALINGSKNMIDMSCLGRGKYCGAINPSFSKILCDISSPFVIIDQSVTGMFERRTKIGL